MPGINCYLPLHPTPSLYPFPLSLSRHPSSFSNKTKGNATFLLKLPFNHWVIASAFASTPPPPGSTFPSLAYLIQLISCVHLACRLISTIYFNKPRVLSKLDTRLHVSLLRTLLTPTLPPLSRRCYCYGSLPLLKVLRVGLKLSIFCSVRTLCLS